MHTAKFKNIIREYKNLVYSQALYSTGNCHDASDITQDVLLTLWNNMDSIRVQTVKPWLLKVTRNKCIDMNRKKREQYFSELKSEDEENSINRIKVENENDPEKNLDRIEQKQQIMDAITRLPEKIRTTVILRYIHDENYDVIARTVGCPLNSVKVYLHRGRKLLAETLNKQTREK